MNEMMKHLPVIGPGRESNPGPAHTIFEGNIFSNIHNNMEKCTVIMMMVIMMMIFYFYFLFFFRSSPSCSIGCFVNLPTQALIPRLEVNFLSVVANFCYQAKFGKQNVFFGSKNVLLY